MLLKLSKNSGFRCWFRCVLNETCNLRISHTAQALSGVFLIKHHSYQKVYRIWDKASLNSLDFFRNYCSIEPERTLDKLTFLNVCSETLDSLSDYFEELIESVPHLKTADVFYSDGVLTVNLGKFGTYVINRQTPNLQIWLSSPTSGPKRYDFVNGTWVYKHDKTTLHSLLDKEIKEIVNQQVNFVENCSYGKPSA